MEGYPRSKKSKFETGGSFEPRSLTDEERSALRKVLKLAKPRNAVFAATIVGASAAASGMMDKYKIEMESRLKPVENTKPAQSAETKADENTFVVNTEGQETFYTTASASGSSLKDSIDSLVEDVNAEGNNLKENIDAVVNEVNNEPNNLESAIDSVVDSLNEEGVLEDGIDSVVESVSSETAVSDASGVIERSVRPMPRPNSQTATEEVDSEISEFAIAEESEEIVRPNPRPNVETVEAVVEPVSYSLPRTETVRSESPSEYFVGIDNSLYENIPENSRDFLTAVLTTKQHILAPEGAFITSSVDGRALGVVPASEIEGTHHAIPSRGFVETGHVTDGFSRDWIRAAKDLAASELGVNAADINADTSNWYELKLAAKKMGRYPDSVADIALHYGNELVPKSGLSRIEYLRDNFFIPNENMPEELKDYLVEIVPGLVGEESRFKDMPDANHADAVTTMQIVKSTWMGMGFPPLSEYEDHIPPYPVLVQALGTHIGNVYNELHDKGNGSNLEEIRTKFASDSDYYKYFLVPYILDAYHAGGGTMRSAAANFTKSDEFADLPSGAGGYDVFNSLSLFARDSNEGPLANYKTESRSYTIRVMAWAQILNEASNNNNSYQVASN